MNKCKSPFLVITIIIMFTWFCMIGEFGFAQQSNKSPLLKARMLAEEGDYNGAIKILNDYVAKIKDKKAESQNLNEAFYLFAKIYYMVGEDKLCDEYLRKIYISNPEFQKEESDFAFKKRVEEVWNRFFVEVEVDEKIDEKKPEAVKKEADQQTTESKPAIKTEPEKEKEAVPQIKDKTEQEKETKAAMTAKQPEAKVKEEKVKQPEKKVISKTTKKKSKKKFPWLLAVGGVVIVGVVLYLLLKKKNSDTQIDPNYDTSVLGIQWINIPAGEFLMGDNFDEGHDYERPVHAVYLDSYSISKFEITWDQYEVFCEEKGWTLPNDYGMGMGNRPVICVPYNSVIAFCEWLSEKTGKNIHLPTEAQWEKAARGTDQRRYPWGNSEPDCSILNYNRCSGITQPIGSFPISISPYGVHDMAGNVREWCSDWFSETYYSESAYMNPTGPGSGMCHVVRGGCFYSSSYTVTTFSRDISAPICEWGDRAYQSLGFRICLEN